jgi:hypothetical protein
MTVGGDGETAARGAVSFFATVERAAAERWERKKTRNFGAAGAVQGAGNRLRKAPFRAIGGTFARPAKAADLLVRNL